MRSRVIIKNQSGDTLVEVLLATVLLSVVLASAFTLSNRATRINQQAFERTQVSNLAQQQAELVRSARDSFRANDPGGADSKAWSDIVSRAQPVVPPLGADCDNVATQALLVSARQSEFYLDGNRDVTDGISLVNNLYNVWTEVERGTDSEFWDVHVFGCWEAAGSNPTNVTSVIIRLEDPS